MWLLLFQILFAIAQDASSDPSEVISFAPSVPVEDIRNNDSLSIPSDAVLPIDAVVLIVQGRTTCAGTLINENGWIATAYHCVAGGGKPGVETRDGRRTIGKVIKTSALYDLAIVEAKGLSGEPHVVLGDALPGVMSPVTVVGHPFGVRKGMGYMGGTLRWSAVTGVVSNVGDQALQISAPLNPGNSGGPVFNRKGELVGVVSRKLAGQAVGFATRVSFLKALLGRERGPSAVGGTLALKSFVSLWTGEWGVLGLGAKMEFSLRDRFVLSIGGAGAPSARWVALQRSQSRWSAFEARVGLRQRVLRGPWSSHVDVFGGLSMVREVRINWRNGGDAFNAEYSIYPRPMFGGSVTLGVWGVDTALIQDGDVWAFRTSIILSWPGGLRVF